MSSLFLDPRRYQARPRGAVRTQAAMDEDLQSVSDGYPFRPRYIASNPEGIEPTIALRYLSTCPRPMRRVQRCDPTL